MKSSAVEGSAVSSSIGRRPFLGSALGGVSTLLFSWTGARPQSAAKVLRIGMTLSDIPLTTGQANQGAEGIRFTNLTLYDSLVRWDLSQSQVPTKLVPSLAVSWSVDNTTHNVWTFKLRDDVKFLDGSPFNAHSVIWNFEKLTKPDAPQYDKLQSTQALNYFTTIKSFRAVDDLTIEITTHSPDATLLYSMTSVFYSSPARWEASGRDWNKFAFNPSGTGPWKLTKLVPRDRAEMVPNRAYWDKTRVPRCDLVLRPMPDATTRVAALLAGQVDFIEAPAPDAVPQLKAAGMHIVTNVYPHIWPYMLNHMETSPFHDVRVRKAANLAIDRDGLVKLLGGLAVPAKGHYPPTHPWFGKPSFDIKYDPDGARKLLEEVGYGPKNPLKVKFLMSAAGSGQMQPVPMNEFIQENMRDAGFDVSLETLDWEALRGHRIVGAENPENKGVDGINYSWAVQEPIFGLIGQTWHGKMRTAGYNWGNMADPKADELAANALRGFGEGELDRRMAALHSYLVDQAMWIWVVHDLNPRALSPHVHGFVQAQNWFQDLTPIRIE
jgi:ABC-type transport system substrate-binding protein